MEDRHLVRITPAALLIPLIAVLCNCYSLCHADGSLIILSDGSDLKLHSGGSSSISTPIRFPETHVNQSSSRIPVVDYTGFTPDIVSIVWLQSPHHLVYGSLHLSSRNLTDLKSHPLPLNVSDLAVDRYSCQRDLILVQQDQGKICKLSVSSMNLEILMDDVHDVSGIFTVNGVAYWIEESRCVFRREILSHNGLKKNKVTCLPGPSASVSAVFVYGSGHDSNVVFLLSSEGDVYRLQEGKGPAIRIIAADEYRDRKILKYQKNDFDSLHVSESPESPFEMQVFAGIKNHGILLHILVHCPDLTDASSCRINGVRDEINEDRLYDFKLLSDPGINCTDYVNTVRSHVLVDRTRKRPLSLSSPAHFTSYMNPTTWIILSALISCLLLLMVTKLLVGLYNEKRPHAPRLGDLLRSHHPDRNAILRRSASIHSVARSQNPLNFPPKAVLHTPVAVCSPSASVLPKAISIEDLTGFENPAFSQSDGRRSRTVSQKSCGTCDYKDECKDMGICLSTYRLLH